jgi:tRNA threonylcarbamoyladenosine biosynthesis protein TsaE
MLSKNTKQTQKIAAELTKKVLRSGLCQKYALVVALVGDLGSGKTTFVQGFAKALGIRHRIVSPTFLIFRRYEISKKIRNPRLAGRQAKSEIRNFYHVDLYRIHHIKELDILNFKSILHSPFNIVLIEWAEKIKKILPKDTIWINFQHGNKENERIIITSLRGNPSL